MKRIIALFCVGLLFPAVSGLAQAPSPPRPGSEEQAILRLGKVWTEAFLHRDLAALDPLLADEFRFGEPDGTVITKAQLFAYLKSGEYSITSMALEGVEVRIYGAAAVVTGLTTEKSQFQGIDSSGQYRWTDMWIQRDGRWQCVAAHASRVLTPSSAKDPAVPPALAPREVVVDGFRLSYTVEGEGIPCLVVDDAPAMRRAVPPGLRSRFRFVFMDPRMDVPSPAGYDLRRITLDTLLDDIERVRRDAGVDHVLVFGHSINGLTAYEYARKYPGHVIGVVMNGTPPFSLKRLGPIQESYWAKAASTERKEAQRKSEEKTREAIAQLPPGEAMRRSYIANAAMYWHDPAYDCAWLLEGVHWNREVWDHLFYSILDEYDITRRPPIPVPVLLTLGRDDYVVPYPVWDGIEKTLPNLTIRIFDKSGHWAPVEEPALFERTLCDWVDAAVLKKKIRTPGGVSATEVRNPRF